MAAAMVNASSNPQAIRKNPAARPPFRQREERDDEREDRGPEEHEVADRRDDRAEPEVPPTLATASTRNATASQPNAA